jgi:hypothetical protein
MTSDEYLDRARYPSEGHDKTYVVSLEEVLRWVLKMGDGRKGLFFSFIRTVKGIKHSLKNASEDQEISQECLQRIPNTWIMCGEGDNYCSEACLQKASSNS